jgi:hypothetical protein
MLFPVVNNTPSTPTVGTNVPEENEVTIIFKKTVPVLPKPQALAFHFNPYETGRIPRIAELFEARQPVKK